MRRTGRALGWVGIAVLGTAMSLWGPAPIARACGGVLCDGGALPVAQANERILFVMEDDGLDGTLVTAVIQIQYQGSVDDFAWILPVPEVPEDIGVAGDDFFDELAAATAPRFNFLFPDFDDDFEGGRRRGGCGGGCLLDPRPSPWASASDAGAKYGFGDPPPSVNVWGTGTVGPYEMAIISSDTIDPLLEWIVRHGFVVPESFPPLADEYVKENYKFVVMRLVPPVEGDQVEQVAPLVLRFHAELPCIPLRLTAVAAVPDMGVRVWIVASGRAVPLNYRSTSPDYSRLTWDTYENVISDEVDLAGSKAWVTEFAGPLRDVVSNPSTFLTVDNPETLAYLERGTYVTRLFTTISPEEMDEDPFFFIDPTAGDVSNGRTVVVGGWAAASLVGSTQWPLAELLVFSVLAGLVLRRRRTKTSSG